jgi:hypothetical protein
MHTLLAGPSIAHWLYLGLVHTVHPMALRYFWQSLAASVKPHAVTPNLYDTAIAWAHLVPAYTRHAGY